MPKASRTSNLALARVYINHTDSKPGPRTWLEVMGNIVAKKSGEKQRHWESAVRANNLDCIRELGGDVGVEHFRGKQFAMKDHPFAVSSEGQRGIG